MRERDIGRPVSFTHHNDLPTFAEDLRQMRAGTSSLFDDKGSDGRKTPVNRSGHQIRNTTSYESRAQIRKSSSNESNSQIRKTSSYGSHSGSGSQTEVVKSISSGSLKEAHASILGYDPNVPNYAPDLAMIDSRDDSEMSPLISLSNSRTSSTSSSSSSSKKVEREEQAHQHKQPQEEDQGSVEDDSELSYTAQFGPPTHLPTTTPMNTPSISSKRKSVTFVEEDNDSDNPRSILRAPRYYPGEENNESFMPQTFISPQTATENAQSKEDFESKADLDDRSEASSKSNSVVGVGSVSSTDTISRVLASYDGRLKIMQQTHESEIEARFDEISDLRRKKLNAEKRYAKTLKDMEQNHSIEKEKIRKIATKNHNTVIKTILSNFQKSFGEKIANSNAEMVSALERIEKEKHAHTAEIMRLKEEQDAHKLRLEQESAEQQEREKMAHRTDIMDLKQSFARLEEQKHEMESELHQLKSTHQHDENSITASENDPSIQNVSRRERPSLERADKYSINGLKKDIVKNRRSRGKVFVESPSKIHATYNTTHHEVSREVLIKLHQEELAEVREEARKKYVLLRDEMTEMSHAHLRDTVMKAAITFESEIEDMRNETEQQIGSMRKELDAWHNDEMESVQRENEVKFKKRAEAEVINKINNARQEIESKFSDLSHGTAEELEEVKSRAMSLEEELRNMITRAEQMEDAKKNLEAEIRSLRHQAVTDIQTLQQQYTELEGELDEERARARTSTTNRSMDSTAELESKLKEMRYLDRKMSADLREEKTRTTDLIAEMNERKTTIKKLHQLNVDLEAQFKELSESYEDNTQELKEARRSVRSLERFLDQEKSTSRQLAEQKSLLEAKLKNVTFITQNANDQQEDSKKKIFLMSRELEKEKEKSKKLMTDYETVSNSLIGTVYFLSKYGFDAF
jgi:hypothetical protein